MKNRELFFTLGGVTASVLLIKLYSLIEWPWFLVGWVSLIPWLAVLDRVRSIAGTLTNALLMSVVFVLVHMNWFAETIRLYTNVSYAAACLTLLLASPILEPQFFAFAVVRYLARNVSARVLAGERHFWYVAVTGALAYVTGEWVLAKLFGETLGHGFFGSRWMRQAADIAGAGGLTFLLLLVNECIWKSAQLLAGPGAIADRAHRVVLPLVVIVAVPIALLVYGFFRCRQLDTAAAAAPKMKIAAVQANISNYDRMAKEIGTYEAVRFILDTHYRMSAEAMKSADPHVIIWPETVYPTTFGSPKSPEGAEFDREIAGFVAAARRPFIFGSYDAEGEKQYNAAVFIGAEADGRISYDMYRKALLFPFTERVPPLLDTPWLRERFPWLGTWTPGAPPEPVLVELNDGRTVRVAPLICYDALEPDLALNAARRGADLIVTISNDSWFATGVAPRLHLLMATFRSIETHLPQVRSTNTGISAAITAAGDVTSTIGTDERGILFTEVALAENIRPLVVRWGNWFPRFALAATLALLAFPRLRGPRRSR